MSSFIPPKKKRGGGKFWSIYCVVFPLFKKQGGGGEKFYPVLRKVENSFVPAIFPFSKLPRIFFFQFPGLVHRKSIYERKRTTRCPCGLNHCCLSFMQFGSLCIALISRLVLITLNLSISWTLIESCITISSICPVSSRGQW